jgi:hypothetical protein
MMDTEAPCYTLPQVTAWLRAVGLPTVLTAVGPVRRGLLSSVLLGDHAGACEAFYVTAVQGNDATREFERLFPLAPAGYNNIAIRRGPDIVVFIGC